jgi:hypothetical protein
MVEKREGQPIMYNPERYGQHLAQDTKRRQIYKKSSFGVKLNKTEINHKCRNIQRNLDKTVNDNSRLHITVNLKLKILSPI